MAAERGIAASVLRKEDELLRGGGQYAVGVRMARMREGAFIRSPLGRARLVSINFPAEHRDCVLTTDDLLGVSLSASSLKRFKCQRKRRMRASRSWPACCFQLIANRRKGGRQMRSDAL